MGKHSKPEHPALRSGMEARGVTDQDTAAKAEIIDALEWKGGQAPIRPNAHPKGWQTGRDY